MCIQIGSDCIIICLHVDDILISDCIIYLYMDDMLIFGTYMYVINETN